MHRKARGSADGRTKLRAQCCRRCHRPPSRSCRWLCCEMPTGRSHRAWVVELSVEVPEPVGSEAGSTEQPSRRQRSRRRGASKGRAVGIDRGRDTVDASAGADIGTVRYFRLRRADNVGVVHVGSREGDVRNIPDKIAIAWGKCRLIRRLGEPTAGRSIADKTQTAPRQLSPWWFQKHVRSCWGRCLWR